MMQKLLILCLALGLAFSAEPNPFADSGDSGDESIFADEQPKTTDKMIFLDAVQKKFWSNDRKPSDNTVNIKFVAGETHKIRTRANMTTTFIFDDDKIASVTLGDSVGFEIKELGVSKYDLSNIITIKPKLIGIDTNLTIIGESGNIYSFYIFSTDHKNRRNPAFMVFISEKRKIGKIKVENLEQKARKEQESAFKKLLGKENDDESKAYLSSFQSSDSIEEETDKEIIIGDKINKITIKKDEIKRGYVQFPKTKWGVESRDSIKLKAKDIFNDKKWTYFKFDRELATSKFPAIFRVIDGYDNPMNSRIVGNYLIVETIADKWTMRIGDEWVCVRTKEAIENALQEQKERKERYEKQYKPSNKKKFGKPPKIFNNTNNSNEYDNIDNNSPQDAIKEIGDSTDSNPQDMQTQESFNDELEPPQGAVIESVVVESNDI